MNKTIRESPNLLFNEVKLDKILAQRKKEILTTIEKCSGESILGAEADDICENLMDKYCPNAPILKNEKICISRFGEKDIDLNKDYESNYGVVRAPNIVKGTCIEFAVPFEGDSWMFRCELPYSTIRQMKTTTNHTRFVRPPYGAISTENNELRFMYSRIDHDSDAIKRDFDQDLKKVQEYLEFLKSDTSKFNDEMIMLARDAIERRKDKLLADEGMIKSFEYPMKKYHKALETYEVPLKRKVVAIEKPTAKTETNAIEPNLGLKIYDEIIKIVSNMALVIERNPKAFQNLSEEDIRTFILMFLNGYYEGNATGETFNFEGKTDIMIRVEGRNVFIAECKFWSGPEGLIATINQLQRYTSSRDTKTAIIFFNHNKNLSAVADKIPDVVRSHPNFKKQLDNLSETAFRFVF